MHEILSRFFTKGTRECAVLCSLLGVLTAVLLICVGIWKTLLVAACAAVGVFIGGVRDKNGVLRRWREQLFGR